MDCKILNIAGPVNYACAEEKEEDGLLYISRAKRVSDLLIVPRGAAANRSPYLQDFRDPEISDLVTGGGEVADLSNTFFLHELLGGLLSGDAEAADGAAGRLSDYFRALPDHLRGPGDAPGDARPGAGRPARPGGGGGASSGAATILPVPDFFPPLVQERILQSTGTRDSFLLLWRSVAACLGAEKELRERKVKNGDRVAVVDASFGYWLVTCLTMRRKGDFLIPLRTAFPWREIPWGNLSPGRGGGGDLRLPGRNGAYPCFRLFRERFAQYAGGGGGDERRFARAVRGDGGAAGALVITEGGHWRRRAFPAGAPNGAAAGVPAASVPGDCKCVIVLGDAAVPGMGAGDPRIVQDPGCGLLLLGAARFAFRREKGLPTYFDQMDGLWIIGQNPREEMIVTDELIPASAECEGGREIRGKEYASAYVEPNSDARGRPHIDFYLSDENVGPDTPLKTYRQEFDIRLQERRRITLFPSAVPGQGLAVVRVRFPQQMGIGDARLDLLQMEDAKEENGASITCSVLEGRMERSFPPDIPHVRASYRKWIGYHNGESRRHAVIAAMQVRDFPESGLFAYATPARNPGGGLDALRRENVFGTDPEKSLPIAPLAGDAFDFDRLFNLLAELWKTDPPHYARLIAWTYQGNHPAFRPIVQATLKRAENMVRGGDRPRLHPQDYTLLGNLLRANKDLARFYQVFLRDGRHFGFPISYWARALAGASSLNNEMFDGISPEDCRKGFLLLADCLKRRNEGRAGGRAVYRNILCSMMFLLKKRRTDPGFIPKEGEVYNGILKVLEETGEIYRNGDPAISGYAETLRRFFTGRGTINGLVAILDESADG